MSYEEEIEDLEDWLTIYNQNKNKNSRITAKIEKFERELNLFKKAQAFDEVLKSFDNSLSEGHMADDVCNIVNKYRGESIESN